jgi:hypothetical protein
MTLRSIRRASRRIVNPIRTLKRKILGIVADCRDAYQIALQTPDDFPWRAAAILSHLTPIVMNILASDLPDIQELECLNDMITFLTLDVEEFIAFFPEQLENMIEVCGTYAPLQPYWDEMEMRLNRYLQQIQGEERLEQVLDEQMVIG